MQHESTEVLFSLHPAKYGHLGVITLNRPQALNAISANMIIAINDRLQKWATDPDVHAVIIQGAGGRAFCAGGDLKFVYYNRDKDISEAVPFFRTEYGLNLFIHEYPKPYIALLDGITMGGGAGLSIHGKRRIASEHLQLAMPETAIGVYPDVGAAYFLPRCPHMLGMYLGLTGNTIGVGDAMLCGLVDAYIPREHLANFVEILATHDLRHAALATVDKVISELQQSPPYAPLLPYLNVIESCFAKDSVVEIIDSLMNNESKWAQQQAILLNTRSPTSLKVTYRHLQLGATRNLQECLMQDFNLILQMIQKPDAFEGIRAVLIDKTYDPKWHPSKLQDVSDVFIDELFAYKY